MPRPPAETSTATELPVLDAKVLAHGGLTWAGKCSDTRFARLADVALSDRPALTVSLAFALQAQRPVVHGVLRGALSLRCQRCWQPMLYPLDEHFDLMLIESEAELEKVPQTHEPWVAHAHRLDVAALIEEQLLLALPLIARHDVSDCPAVTAAPETAPARPRRKTVKASAETAAKDIVDEGVQRPFGNLRDLLGK